MTANEYLKEVLQSEDVNKDPELPKLNRLKREFKELLDQTYPGKVSVNASGSSAKNTAIRSSYDIDLFVYFAKGSFNNEKEMYEAVFQLFNKRYGNVAQGGTIRRQHYSIGYVYDDDATIDIVPALRKDDSDFAYIYSTSPQSPGTKRTNIKLHIEKIAQNKVSDVVRLLKVWKFHKGQDLKALRSYGIELLAIEALTSKKINLLDEKVLAVWDYIAENLDKIKLIDFADSNNDLLAQLNEQQKSTIIKRANTARRTVREAADKLSVWQKEIPKR